VTSQWAGTWFSEFGSLPRAFAYDTYDPAQVRISTFGFAQIGVFATAATEPLPRDVSVATALHADPRHHRPAAATTFIR